MLFNSVKFAGFGLAIAIALGVAATRGHSEIAVTGGQKPANTAPVADKNAATGDLAKQGTSLQVQCWQYGVKIIDEKDVFGIRLQNLIERDSLRFSGRDSNSGDIYVIPVNGDSTCLIKPLR
jgi:hypothetical protein